MAKILNGILGGFSGKVGTVIGACWKGIDYMRGLATSVTNPNTPAQIEQRARFSLIIAFLRPLTGLLRTGFRSAAIRQSAFNAAMAYNVKNAISGAYPAFAIDYPKVLFSRGSLAGVLNPTCVAAADNRLNFTWDDNSQEFNSMASDQAVLVVYNPFRKQAVTLFGGASRVTGAENILLPEVFTGDTVECYIAFMGASGSEISDSQWVASLTVL